MEDQFQNSLLGGIEEVLTHGAPAADHEHPARCDLPRVRELCCRVFPGTLRAPGRDDNLANREDDPGN